MQPHVTTNNIPYGYCHCGCGQKTTIAKYSSADRGHVKGEPVRFIKGHSTRVRTNPVPIGKDNPNFRDGKTISHGYVVLSSKKWGTNHGRYEHRVVMEKALERELSPDEIIHHINGDKTDNRLENLELTTRQDHNKKHGTGRYMVCAKCSAEKWYSGAMIQRLHNQGDGYLCLACSEKSSYTKTCKKCGNTFLGGRTAYLCINCVVSPRHKAVRT